MAIQECVNGHLFDSDQYAECPYCQNQVNRINFQEPDNIGKTSAPASYIGGAFDDIGKTSAPASYRNNEDSDEGLGKTVGVFRKKMSFEPIVGWLVCIDGPEKGTDYRIYGKVNKIGRSDKNDICIRKDQTISRDDHARLGYDERHNAFHIIPGDSSNSVYLRDQPVYVPMMLEPFDLLEIGECKLVFVPFCGKDFTWKNGLAGEGAKEE